MQDKGSDVRTRDYTFFYGKRNENYPVGAGVLVNQGIVSAGKRVMFVSDRMSYIVLRGQWCNIIVLNAHALTEERSDHIKHSFYEELDQVFDHFPKYAMKILLGDFNAKLGTKTVFKLTIGNESLHQNGNDNGFRTVNFAISKNLGLKSTMFPHQNIINTPGPLLIGRLKTRLSHIDR